MTENRKSGENTAPDAPGMAMYETTHTSLLEAAKNGNMTAKKWTEFCDRYRDTLVRYANRFYKVPLDLTENAVQEMFLQMWRSSRVPTDSTRPHFAAANRFSCRSISFNASSSVIGLLL